MKGLICGIKRMEIHDGDGLRTTVFFKGCPLKCVWCHNPESVSFLPQVAVFSAKCCGCGGCAKTCPHGLSDCDACGECAENCPTAARVLYGQEYEAEALCEVLAQDVPFFEHSGGGVTLSGGECLAQPDFAVALAKALCDRGISVYVDTCGFVPREVFDRIRPYTRKFLYDLKAIDPAVHKACTGRDNVRILENLQYLIDCDCAVEIRYPLVMGYNDGECEKIAHFLKEQKTTPVVKVLQYHNYAGSRYEALGMTNTLPQTETTPDDVARAVDCLKSHGVPAINGITDN